MESTGFVVSIASKHMMVQCDRTTNCVSCASTSGCSAGLINSLFRFQPVVYRVPKIVGVSVGHHVLVEIPDTLALKLAMIGYCLPIILLLLFAIISQYAVVPGLGANLTALIAGCSGFLGGLIAYKPLSGYVLSDIEDTLVARAALVTDNG